MRNGFVAIVGMLMCLLSMDSLGAVSDQEIDRYLQKSELYKIFANFDEQLEAQITQAKVAADDQKSVEQVSTVMLGTWDEAKANAILKDSLKYDFTSEELKNLFKWYDQTWVKNIKVAERQSDEPNFESAMVRFFEDMAKQPPSAERIQVVQGYVENTQMLDVALELIVNLVSAMQSAFEAARGEPTGSSSMAPAELRALMEPQMKQGVTMMSFYLYRDISDTDLQSYGDFYASALGKREVAIIMRGINKVMTAWTNDMAKEGTAIFGR